MSKRLLFEYEDFSKFNKKNIKVTKNVHQAWRELQNLKSNNIFKNVIGKFHYNFKSKKGHISMIESYDFKDNSYWEIMCIGNSLFEGCCRFDTKDKAEKEIMRLLK